MSVSSRGLFGYLARLHMPASADSDADLLDQFVRTGDESAFAGLVRRHGPMVLNVCRRRLRSDSDAEDAFQAVFLALATSAHSIGRRSSLAGWLYRVAYLIALKAAGRRARLPVTAIETEEVPMPAPSTSAGETHELKAIIDSELAGLPDKFRSVVVLCLIEGQTNTEAAAVLGVPVGTIDSRLNTARRRLQDRLTRRGVALGLSITLEQMLGGPLGASDRSATQELIASTVRAVLAEIAGPGTGAVSPAVVELARGATTMMTTKLRMIAIVGITLGVLGGAGAGLYYAMAADPVKPVAKVADQKLTPATVAAPVANPLPAANPEANADAGAGALALLKPFGVKPEPKGTPLEEILTHIEDQSELVIRVDVAAFLRVGIVSTDMGGDMTAEQLLKSIYESKVLLPRRADKLLTRDVLADSLAQVPVSPPCTFQIRGTQLLIVPAYVPPVAPGVNPLDLNGGDPNVPADPPVVNVKVLNEQIHGGVVNLTADRKPLADVLADLRKQTGANIILDPRCEALEKKATLSITLSDVRLYDALRVIADMADLKMVYAGNIYYVTTAANAKSFQPPVRPMPQPPAQQPFPPQAVPALPGK
ncbi:MAG: sigma-70 family RNA polymerase sigma factor [Planctomycetes bacterium]|nr:sigma-70 family RNA polymerase sigma factor [Planctomycetota bacterium]